MQCVVIRLGMPMTTNIDDQYISLSCTVPKRRYQVNDTVDIQFSVTNTSHEAVYLVTPEPEDISCVLRLKDKNDSEVISKVEKIPNLGVKSGIPS